MKQLKEAFMLTGEDLVLESVSGNKQIIPVNQLWGTNLKQLKSFPLREFAEVYYLICNLGSENRSYFKDSSIYGGSTGRVVIHLYNVGEDFVIDILDGEETVEVRYNRAVISNEGNYKCVSSSLSSGELIGLNNSLKYLMSYCDKNNISDVYLSYPMYWTYSALLEMCSYLIKHNKNSIKDYLNSSECREYYSGYSKKDMSEIVKRVGSSFKAYISRYEDEGIYINHANGSYCLVLYYG